MGGALGEAWVRQRVVCVVLSSVLVRSIRALQASTPQSPIQTIQPSNRKPTPTWLSHADVPPHAQQVAGAVGLVGVVALQAGRAAGAGALRGAEALDLLGLGCAFVYVLFEGVGALVSCACVLPSARGSNRTRSLAAAVVVSWGYPGSCLHCATTLPSPRHIGW